MGKLNICVVHRYPLDIVLGTGPHFASMLQQFVSDGHNVDLMTFKSDNVVVPAGVNLKPLNYHFNRAGKHDNIKSILFLLLVPIKLLSSKTRYDVIFCDDSLPIYWFLIKLISGKHTKVILHTGDAWGLLLQHKCYPTVVRWLAKLMNYCENKFMFNALDLIIVIGNAFKQYLVGCGVKSDLIVVVGDAIDLSKFKQVFEAEHGNKIINHGFFHTHKKSYIIVEAIKLVLQKHPKQRFVFAGDGPELCAMQCLSESLGITANIEFTGWLPFHALVAKMQECNIGITCRSNDRSNEVVTTTSILQDMAAGLAVIASNGLAIRELLAKDGGLIYEAEDAKSLANQICYLLDNPERISQYRHNAFKIASSRSNDIIAKQLCNAVYCLQ